jgi:hypothetical protein
VLPASKKMARMDVEQEISTALELGGPDWDTVNRCPPRFLPDP